MLDFLVWAGCRSACKRMSESYTMFYVHHCVQLCWYTIVQSALRVQNRNKGYLHNMLSLLHQQVFVHNLHILCVCTKIVVLQSCTQDFATKMYRRKALHNFSFLGTLCVPV